MAHKVKKLQLWLFYDGIERFLVSCYNREDAFNVIEERYSSDAADELIMSKMKRIHHKDLKIKKPKMRGIIMHEVL